MKGLLLLICLVGFSKTVMAEDDYWRGYDSLPATQGCPSQESYLNITPMYNDCDELPIDNISVFEIGGDVLKSEIVIASYAKKYITILFDMDFEEFSQFFLDVQDNDPKVDLDEKSTSYSNMQNPTDLITPKTYEYGSYFKYCVANIQRMVIIDFSMQDNLGTAIGMGLTVGDFDNSGDGLTHSGDELVIGDPTYGEGTGIIYLIPDAYDKLFPLKGNIVNATYLQTVSVKGDFPGEGFGANVRSGHLDLDKADDLVVVSPNFTKQYCCPGACTPQEEQTYPSYYDCIVEECEDAVYADEFVGKPYYMTEAALASRGSGLIAERCIEDHPIRKFNAGRVQVLYGSELVRPWEGEWTEYQIDNTTTTETYANRMSVSGGVTFHLFGYQDYGYCELDSSQVGTNLSIEDVNGDGVDDLILPSTHAKINLGFVLDKPESGQVTAGDKQYEFSESEILHRQVVLTTVYNWSEPGILDPNQEVDRILGNHTVGSLYSSYLGSMRSEQSQLVGTTLSSIPPEGTIPTGDPPGIEDSQTTIVPPRRDLDLVMPTIPEYALQRHHVSVFRTGIESNILGIRYMESGHFWASPMPQDPPAQTLQVADEVADGFRQDAERWGIIEPEGEIPDYADMEEQRRLFKLRYPDHSEVDLYGDVILTLEDDQDKCPESYVFPGGQLFFQDAKVVMGMAQEVRSAGDVNDDGLDDLLLLYQNDPEHQGQSVAKIFYGRTDWSHITVRRPLEIIKGIYREVVVSESQLKNDLLTAHWLHYPRSDQGSELLVMWNTSDTAHPAQNVGHLWQFARSPELRIQKSPDANHFLMANVGPDTLHILNKELGALQRDQSRVNDAQVGSVDWGTAFTDEKLLTWWNAFPLVLPPNAFMEFDFDTTLMACPTHGIFRRYLNFKTDDWIHPLRAIDVEKIWLDPDIHFDASEQSQQDRPRTDVQVPNEFVEEVAVPLDGNPDVLAYEYRYGELTWGANQKEVHFENWGNVPLVVDTVCIVNLAVDPTSTDNSRMDVEHLIKYFRVYVDGLEFQYAGIRPLAPTDPDQRVDVFVGKAAIPPYGGDGVAIATFEPVDHIDILPFDLLVKTSDPGDDYDMVSQAVEMENQDRITGLNGWRGLAPGLVMKPYLRSERDSWWQMLEPGSHVSADYNLGDVRVVDADSANTDYDLHVANSSLQLDLPYPLTCPPFRIGNDGNVPLELTGLEVQSSLNPATGDAAFVLSSAPHPVGLPAGAGANIAVEFRPWDLGDYEALVLIHGNGDNANRSVPSADPHVSISPNRIFAERDCIVRVHGRGRAPDVDLKATNFDFGTVPYDPIVSITRSGVIGNRGNLDLVVSSVEQGFSLETDNPFIVQHDWSVPLVVYPGQTTPVEVDLDMSSIDVADLPKTFTSVWRFRGNDPTPGQEVFDVEMKATIVPNYVRVSALNLAFGTAMQHGAPRQVVVCLENMCYNDNLASLTFDVDGVWNSLQYAIEIQGPNGWDAFNGESISIVRGHETYLRFTMLTDNVTPTQVIETCSFVWDTQGIGALDADDMLPSSRQLDFVLSGAVTSEPLNVIEEITYFDEKRYVSKATIVNEMGLPIQVQESAGDETVVTQMVYDQYGRPVAESLPAQVGDPTVREVHLLTYSPTEEKIGLGADAALFLETQSLLGFGEKPYREMVYESNPFKRLLAAYTPDSADGSRLVDRSFYGVVPGGSPRAAVWERIFRDKVDEDGVSDGKELTLVETIKDIQGQPTRITKHEVLELTGLNPRDLVGGMTNTTTFQYDDLGQTTNICPPRSQDDVEGPALSPLTTKLYYNTLGQVVRKVVPDIAEGRDFRYVYDVLGHLRFFQDPNLQVASEGQLEVKFYYYNYDAFGNLIEVGIGSGKQMPDAAVGPYQGGEILAQYAYGECAFNTENTAGRLSSQRYNFHRIPFYPAELNQGFTVDDYLEDNLIALGDTLVCDETFFSYRFDGKVDWILNKYHELTYHKPAVTQYEGCGGQPQEDGAICFLYHPVYHKIRYQYDRAGHVLRENGMLTNGRQWTVDGNPEDPGASDMDLYEHQYHRKSYTYDAWGRLHEVAEFGQDQDYALKLAEYAYSFNGLLLEERLGGSEAADGATVYDQVRNYKYDQLGRLAALNQDLHGANPPVAADPSRRFSQSLDYDKQGNIERELRTVTTGSAEVPAQSIRDMRFRYDYLGRLIAAATEPVPGETATEAYTYDYDANGNLEVQTSTFQGGNRTAEESETLRYDVNDKSNRVESVTRTDLAGTEVTYAMSYDANGNLKSDALPRLGSGGTTISDIHSNYQNLPSRIELDLAGSDNTGVIEYRYDTEGRQISRWSWELDAVTGEKVAGTEGNEWSYYDALGRLDARVGLAGGVLDHRLVNLLQVGRRPEGEVGQWVRREFMASDADPDDPLLPGHLTRHWSTYGARGLLAQTHAPITGAATHEKDVVEAEVVLNDHLGSPRLRLGSSRQVEMGGEVPDLELLGITTSWMPKNPMDYTPFGRELALSSDSKTTPDGYTGKPLDITFGLQAMNYGARFYDPRLGRWWQRDPHAANYPTQSSYQYCANNPVLLLDSDGKDYSVSIDKENKVINYTAEIYVDPGNTGAIEVANDAAKNWKDRSGMRVKIDGEKYTVNFNIQVKEGKPSYAGSDRNKPTNVFQLIDAITLPGGSDGKSGTTYGKWCQVIMAQKGEDAFQDNVEALDHEIGHMLGLTRKDDHNPVNGLMAKYGNKTPGNKFPGAIFPDEIRKSVDRARNDRNESYPIGTIK